MPELGFIGKNSCIKLTREVIDGNEEIFARSHFVFSLDEWKTLGIEVNELSGIRFAISLGLVLLSNLNLIFNFGDSFETIFKVSKPFISAASMDEFLTSTSFKSFGNCLS